MPASGYLLAVCKPAKLEFGMLDSLGGARYTKGYIATVVSIGPLYLSTCGCLGSGQPIASNALRPRPSRHRVVTSGLSRSSCGGSRGPSLGCLRDRVGDCRLLG